MFVLMNNSKTTLKKMYNRVLEYSNTWGIYHTYVCTYINYIHLTNKFLIILILNKNW